MQAVIAYKKKEEKKSASLSAFKEVWVELMISNKQPGDTLLQS